jgi:hypothetical protein
MRILDPVLGIDVSSWVNHINARELEDSGCETVVVGLYPQWVNGVQKLNPICRAQCTEVVTHSGMVLQAYFWDDIIKDPNKQADWLADTLAKEGLPIKFVWADQEQWWSNWTLWYQLRRGEIPASQVPRATPANIAWHNQTFCKRLYTRWQKLGVYTNNGFVASWASPMNTWLPQYPAWVPHYGRQPATAMSMSWEQLKAQWMPNYNILLAPGQPAGQVKGHQFTGDRCMLPGSYDQYNRRTPLDVNVFERAFIQALRGETIPPVVEPPVVIPPVIPPNTWESTANPNVRSYPDSSTPANITGIAYKGTRVVVDQQQPYWIHFKPIKDVFPMGGWTWKAYWKQLA